MEIDTIKNYLLNKKEFDRIIDEIYKLTENLEEIYPSYKEWFFKKQVRGCDGPHRIYFLREMIVAK